MTESQFKQMKLSAVASLQDYNRLNAAIKAKFPNVPAHSVMEAAKFFFRNTAHREYLSKWLEQASVWWLNNEGAMCKKVETTGKLIKGKSGKDVYIKHRAAKKGEPDISGVLNGKAFYIEIKVGRDRLSDDQKSYIQRLERAGAKVAVCGTLGEVMEFCNTLKE